MTLTILMLLTPLTAASVGQDMTTIALGVVDEYQIEVHQGTKKDLSMNFLKKTACKRN